MEEATGEFIHFFDSDDIAAPNKHGHEKVEEVLTTDDRINTDTRRISRITPRGPVLALRFQIPPQASLHGLLKTHRPLAPRAALLRRFLLIMRK